MLIHILPTSYPHILLLKINLFQWGVEKALDGETVDHVMRKNVDNF